MTKRRKKYDWKTTDEMLDDLEEEASRFNMDLDQFLRSSSLSKSAILRAAIDSPLNDPPENEGERK